MNKSETKAKIQGSEPVSAGSSAKPSKIDLKRRATRSKNRGRGGGTKVAPAGRSPKLIQPEKKCDKGAYREDDLARRMGLARQYLRDYREKHLTEGKQWFLDGNAVLWHYTAVDGLLKQLRLEINDIPAKQTPHLLQIKKHYPNKRLLGCVDPDGNLDLIQTVWVTDNTKFNIHQLIPVEFQGDRLVLSCRQPRVKGKLK